MFAGITTIFILIYLSYRLIVTSTHGSGKLHNPCLLCVRFMGSRGYLNITNLAKIYERVPGGRSVVYADS